MGPASVLAVKAFRITARFWPAEVTIASPALASLDPENAVLTLTVASNITMRQFLPHAYGFRATATGLLTRPRVTFPLIFEA
jgi:hypothetical protein